MPELVLPTAAVQESFVAAMEEFRAEGRAEAVGNSSITQELREFGDTWRDPEVFGRYVMTLLDERWTPRREGFVTATTLWLVDGEEFLGRIAIRHRLNDFLREIGGHIGYDVRKSARRRGHATFMLKEALPVAHSLGIESALITCDVDNVASRKVIEANGGVLEGERGGKLRFWTPTA
ncbi:GNAT family N-acetyltransferase [Actinomadura sp. NAK00032]|uniref:GNAT family N-acetyltransferase n=1 Tax=Actinomadura sp. NAK00032 TaxID=2742128 RepID=UPI0015920630|nr:GNAT family N-acetyltransferase [Actinomadura sp. NAK00032]QKW32708.1 GNAT family N-acetyltransferase [Actinomadura sp. NAK00032]